MDKKLIALTGGGTAGHVMPHVAMLDEFRRNGWDVVYIGSSGIEKDIIARFPVPFFEIAAGKLRRYFSYDNFKDVIKVLWGIIQSLGILVRYRPRVVYSKGGFVSVPVALAAWLLRIPVVSHESDLTPGLANRIIALFAKEILYSFPETERFLAGKRASLVGIPVRKELFGGNSDRAKVLCDFHGEPKPVVLFMGGSLGAKALNDVVEAGLSKLLERYWVIHITGRGKANALKYPGYFQVEYISEGLEDLLALAQVVVCRAGANSLFELLALKKSMILVPLVMGSRGDQLDNARCFSQHGWARILPEEALSVERLNLEIDASIAEREAQTKAFDAAPAGKAAEQRVLAVLNKYG